VEFLAKFLEQQPILALFLVIALGYAIGQINIKGFSLGVGAVLFAGLAVGAISPRSQPPAIIGTLGIVLFLYGIGISYGKHFFAGLASKTGLRYNMLALFALIVTTGVTVGLGVIGKTPMTYMVGLFSGATTTAAAVMAAVDAAKNTDPAIAYSVAFPVGLLGTILGMYFMQLIVKPRIDSFAQNQIRTIEVEVRPSTVAGITISELMKRLPAGVKILAVRTEDKNQIPRAEYVLAPTDVLLLGSENTSALDAACEIIGKEAPGQIVKDRSHLDYLRVFASSGNVVGLRLSEIKLPKGVDANIVQVRRGDSDLIANPDVIVEFGDRIGVLCDRNYFDGIRKYFGDSIRSTTEFSYVALGIGMVLGVFFSIIPIPLPGIGTLKLGIPAGVLLVSLILGKLGRSGPITWTIPFSANVILRNFGVSLFLAQIGMSSGEKFVTTIQQTGASFLILGAIILMPLVLIPFLIGHFVMRIPFDDLLGVTSGLAGNAAIVSYASKAVPSERVEISYAMIYPGAIILKIIIAQALIVIGS
jgi:putative transport protein